MDDLFWTCNTHIEKGNKGKNKASITLSQFPFVQSTVRQERIVLPNTFQSNNSCFPVSQRGSNSKAPIRKSMIDIIRDIWDGKVIAENALFKSDPLSLVLILYQDFLKWSVHWLQDRTNIKYWQSDDRGLLLFLKETISSLSPEAKSSLPTQM